MEKRTPHHSLNRAKELIRKGSYRVTLEAQTTALRDFVGLVAPSAIAGCVLQLERKDFYKSMTTYHDHTKWQDVYHREVSGVIAYIKIQIEATPEEQTVVISFKRKEDL